MASANATYGQKESTDQNFDYMFKILIIGNSSVGKTSFLFRYADDSFTPAFVSTVGIDFKVKTIYRNDKRIKLQIWVRKCLQPCWGWAASESDKIYVLSSIAHSGLLKFRPILLFVFIYVLLYIHILYIRYLCYWPHLSSQVKSKGCNRLPSIYSLCIWWNIF